METVDPRWRKSSFSGNGGNCVQVGGAGRGVLVRDTQDRQGPVLAFSPAVWRRFADQVKAGSEKIITKNGESYVALIDAERLDYYHRLEHERIHLLLIDEAEKGLIDVEAGRTRDARAALADLKRDAQRASRSRTR